MVGGGLYFFMSTSFILGIFFLPTSEAAPESVQTVVTFKARYLAFILHMDTSSG